MYKHGMALKTCEALENRKVYKNVNVSKYCKKFNHKYFLFQYFTLNTKNNKPYFVWYILCQKVFVLWWLESGVGNIGVTACRQAGRGWRLSATYRDGGGFVNDHHILVHVHNGDGVCSHGHLVSGTNALMLLPRLSSTLQVTTYRTVSFCR